MRKKGAALVMMLVIISLLLVLSASILSTSTSTIKTTLTVDRVNRTNLTAQSGISQGIAVLKNVIPPNVPAVIKYNILDDSGNVNVKNFGTVSFSYSNGAYTITSTASYNGYAKTVSQIITVNVQGNNNTNGLNSVKQLLNYTLGVVNSSNSSNYSLNFKSQGAAVDLTFNGPVYLSGNPSNFTSDINARITINDTITTNQQPGINNAAPKNKKGTVVDASDIIPISNNISFPSLTNIMIGGTTPVVVNVNGYTVKLINGDYNMTAADGNGNEIIICSGGVHFNKNSGNYFNGLNIYSNGIYIEDNGNYSVNITGNILSSGDVNAICSALSSYIQ